MKKIQGSTLLEILLAFFLFSLLLISLDAMQVGILQKTKAHMYFQIANQHIKNLLEILNVSPEVNSVLLRQWQAQTKQSLPQGLALLQRHQRSYEINIIWGERNSTCEQTKMEVNGCIHFLAKR